MRFQAAAGLVCLSSCTAQVSPEDARSKLASIGTPFTPESFVEQSSDGDTLAVALFILAGMDPDHAEHAGLTPLSAAALRGQSTVVAQLLRLGADPNAAPPDEPGPLFRAASHGRADIVQMLLSAGADSSRGYDFLTPMASAAEAGHADVVRLFLGHPERRLGQGLAMVGAISSDRADVVHLMATHGEGVEIGLRAADVQGKPLMRQIILEAQRAGL